MRIHYFSDIHLEFGDFELPEVEADVIVAAGDIGIGLKGLHWLARQKRPVVYVAGNHEFYTYDHNTLIAQLKQSAHGSLVHFLENQSCVIEGVRFLGCTLWTDLGDEEDVAAFTDSVNDFRKIQFSGQAYLPEHYRQLHYHSRTWLEQMLNIPFAGPTVVVTHHAPTFWSWDGRPSALSRFAYCND